MQSLAGQACPSITRQAISKYERGEAMPPSSVLVSLAKALGVSPDFLTGTQIEEIEGLKFRRHSRTRVPDRASAEVALIDHLERYVSIEEILGLAPADDPFAGHRSDSVATEEEIDRRADALRNAWNLGMDPLPSLSGLLESKGIKVIEVDLPEGVNGLTCRALRGGKPVAEALVVSSRADASWSAAAAAGSRVGAPPAARRTR